MANYLTKQSGVARIQNLSAIGYLVFVGDNALPDLEAAPFTIVASLPANIGWALPGAGTHVLSIVIRARDSWGLVSNNQNAYKLTLTPTGPIDNDIAAPTNVRVMPRPAGAIRILASYTPFDTDLPPADAMNVWVNTGAIDPLVDPPTYISTPISSQIGIEFGAFAPDDYNVAVALFRISDAFQSEAVLNTVTIPAIPDEPIPVFTGHVIQEP